MKELTCDTCQWYRRECNDLITEAYEGRTGHVVGDDWCELYMPKENGGSEE